MASMPALTPRVCVHPLVLLSVTDHHYRIVKNLGKKRVLGVLLGEVEKGKEGKEDTIQCTNSFAIPFEEDAASPGIFFLDHDYLEELYYMFKKVAAAEKIVGFYSTSPKIRPADIEVDALFRRLPFATAHPVLVLVDVRADVEGLPVQAYRTIEAVVEGKENVRTFVHLACEVGAYEAEEVGVEHLLRDINDPCVSTTATELRHKLAGLKGLRGNLDELAAYLAAVVEGRFPANREILNHVQTLLSSLPDASAPAVSAAGSENVNDQHLTVYIAALTRAVLALHDLLGTKQRYKSVEDGEASGEAAADAKAKDDKEKEKDKSDGKAKPA